MDYNGWIISIYEECQRIYNNKHNPNGIRGYKIIIQNIKILKKKENLRDTFSILVLAIGLIVDFILITTHLITLKDYIAVFACLALIALIGMPNAGLRLDYYKEMVGILREVLQKEKLHKKEIVMDLKNHTGGIFDKIKTQKVITVVNSIISIGMFKIIEDAVRKTSKQSLVYIMILLLFIVPICSFVYLLYSYIPNGRIEKKRDIHELLKILISYDFTGKEDEDNIRIGTPNKDIETENDNEKIQN